ncbi:hypothetical protein ACRAQ6_08510 [Erythrobacter sp. HA6-11]
MKRKLALLALAVVAAFAAYIGYAFHGMAGPYELDSAKQEFSLLSWSDYRERAADYDLPIILEAEAGQGAFLFFGAEHSNDPSHPQFARLEEAFARFAPTAVIVEGRQGPLFAPFMDPIETYGESGALTQLARGEGAKAYIWELERDEEVALLQDKFSEEQVAIYLLMRPFPGGASQSEAEGSLSAIIDDRKGRPGINGVIGSLEQFDAAWDRNLLSGEDWRELNGVYGAPGFLGEMFEYGNDIRDQHMLNIVRELLEQDERVMVTMGWSHAVRVEPAMTQLAK